MHCCVLIYVCCTKNESCDASIVNQNIPINLNFLPHRLQREKMVTDLNFGFVVLFLYKTDDELAGWF